MEQAEISKILVLASLAHHAQVQIKQTHDAIKELCEQLGIVQSGTGITNEEIVDIAWRDISILAGRSPKPQPINWEAIKSNKGF